MRQLSVFHGDGEWHEWLLLHRNLRLSALVAKGLLRLKWRRWRQGLLGLCPRTWAYLSCLGNLEISNLDLVLHMYDMNTITK